MKLLMISGDRSLLRGRKGAFWYTLQGLRQYFERIDILCPRGPAPVPPHSMGTLLQSMEARGGAVFVHPAPGGLLRQVHWIRKRGVALAREHNHHVMTVHEYPPFYNGLGAAAVHRITGIPYVLEIHHIVGWPVAADVQECIGYALSRLLLTLDAKPAAAVRTVNADVAAQLRRWGVPGEKVHVIPSFYLDATLLTSVAAPSPIYDLVCCARMVPNKGIEQVIDALRILRNARLLIIGDGPLRKALERRVRKQELQERVTFLGWLPTQEAVLGALRSARVFVMASSSEGGPRSALEAMGCGMPVIATRVGVMPEVVRDGENGVFTDGTPEDIAAKAASLLRDEALRKRMGAAASRILDVYERSRLIRQYAEFLTSVATMSTTTP